MSPEVKVAAVPLTLIPSVLILGLGLFGLNTVSKLPLGAYQLTGYIHLMLLPLITLAFYISLNWFGGTLLIAKRFQALFYILIIILSTLGLKGWNTQHLSNRLIEEQAQLAFYFNLGRQLSDSDGDGVSALLGGGDCDDTNPNINPMARDIQKWD